MKRQIGPVWSDQQLKAGARISQAWEAFFAAAEAPGKSASDLGDDGRVEAVLRRHEADLLGRANVVGVAAGLRLRGGQPTGEPCITVYVARKLPEGELAEADLLPKDIDGIPLDVVEVGKLEAL